MAAHYAHVIGITTFELETGAGGIMRELVAALSVPTRAAKLRGPSIRLLAPVVMVGLVAASCAGSASPGSAGVPSASPSAAGVMTIYAPGGTYTSVSPRELEQMLSAKDFVLVNVHVPYEGELEGTDAFIPYDQVAIRLSELPAQRDAKIVLYCRSGRMSTEAARTLVGLGFTNLWELDGGMIAWESGGYQLVRRPLG